MQLYLVQHGEAVPKEIDPERPLTEKGVSDVSKIAKFLKQLQITIDTIFHSGKMRALQTARILANTLNPKCNLIQREGLSPDDPVDSIYGEISKRDEDLMIVGHLPFLAKLSSKLITGSEDENIIEFKQGGVVALVRKEGTWQVRWLMPPELL